MQVAGRSRQGAYSINMLYGPMPSNEAAYRKCSTSSNKYAQQSDLTCAGEPFNMFRCSCSYGVCFSNRWVVITPYLHEATPGPSGPRKERRHWPFDSLLVCFREVSRHTAFAFSEKAKHASAILLLA